MSTSESSTAEPYVCEHCDDSVPHKHVDEGPLVDAYRRDLLRATYAAAGVALVFVTLLVNFGLDAALAVPFGAAAWGLAQTVGVVVLAFTQRHQQITTAVLAGAIASAAFAPVFALVVAANVDGPIVWRATNAALGWLTISAITGGVRTGKLRHLLTLNTREGEAARLAVVRSAGKPSPYVEGAWLVLTAFVFGLCVAAVAVLPVLVLVLVPLNVALAVLTRRAHAAAYRAAAKQ